MKKANAAIWLIILLCFIISGLVWLTVSNNCRQQVEILNQRIKSLNQEIETVKKQNKINCQEIKSASPAASLKPKPTKPQKSNVQ